MRFHNAIKVFLKTNRTLIFLVLGSACFSSLLTAFLLKSILKCPQVLTLDLKSIMREELSRDLKEKSPQEMEKSFREVLQKNLQALEQLTHNKKVIVLSKEAVLKGGEDITKYFNLQGGKK